VSSAGAEAVELAATAGLILDPWQQHILDVMLAERADGRWASFETAVLVARQNGKGGVLEARELAGLFLFGERLILHSAHEFKTAQEAFLRIRSLIDNTDSLRKRVARVRTSHGDEGIELIGGARLRFVARSRSSGRGFSGDCIIMDECQELPRAAMGALLPTLSARPNPQIIYTGTVPDAGNNSEHFESLRDRGRKGDDATLAWLEWSPDPELTDPSDRRAWAQSNPALGYRITEETIERELASLGDDEFSRERLSIWRDDHHDTVVDLVKWNSLANEGRPESPVVFAIDVTPDRRRAAIAVAGRRSDGTTHVHITDADKGTGWVVQRVADLASRHGNLGVVVDPSGPAGSLVTGLEAAGITPETVSARDMAAACGLFVDSVHQGHLEHSGQAVLTSAVTSAATRPLGDAFAWRRKDAAASDISPLVAASLAVHGFHKLSSRPPAPPRSGVVRGIR
jgi:phage terminase large subunit-like protein